MFDPPTPPTDPDAGLSPGDPGADLASSETPETALDLGRRLLRDMLPATVPGAPGFDVAAGTTLEEGGPANTVWDALSVGDGRTAFLVMEVKTPGYPPAHLLGMARAALRAAADGRPLDELLARANEALAAVHTDGIDQFVDCAVVVPGHGEVEWSAAGRIPAGVLGRDGTFHALASHGPPLGMLEGFRYGTERAAMVSGSSLLALAGGSTGLFRGAADLVAEVQEKTAGEVVGTVHRAVRRAHPDGSKEVSVLFLRKH